MNPSSIPEREQNGSEARNITERERDLEKKLYAYKQSFDEIWWMARRYADGRRTYAPDLFNDALRRVMAVGFEPKPDHDGTVWATEGR